MSATRKEWLFAAVSALLLGLVVLSAAIRHSVLCESGFVEETEPRAQLARQSLDARLLSVEQEVLENTLVVQRVIDALLNARRDALDAYAADPAGFQSPPRRLQFSDLYADPEKLFLEIDAAFDRYDDDLFAGAAPGGRGAKGVAAEDPFARADETTALAFEASQPPVGEIDGRFVDEATPDGGERESPGDAVDELGGGSLDDPRATCDELARTYGIVPDISWGSAAAALDVQRRWQNLDCDSLVSSSGRP